MKSFVLSLTRLGSPHDLLSEAPCVSLFTSFGELSPDKSSGAAIQYEIPEGFR